MLGKPGGGAHLASTYEGPGITASPGTTGAMRFFMAEGVSHGPRNGWENLKFTGEIAWREEKSAAFGIPIRNLHAHAGLCETLYSVLMVITYRRQAAS